MPCGITGLCGISSRFRLLSPCTGQVTHALLTRPPLSNMVRHPERIRSVLFVRLACVRHAASVHPEPGSNSHIMVFSWTEFIFCRSPCAGIISLRFFLIPSGILRGLSIRILRFSWLSPEISFLFSWIFRVVWLSNFQGSVSAARLSVTLSCVSEVYLTKHFD